MSNISIIVPTYNVEAYIDQCLQSFSTQSFQDFEVLIIDDGSKQNELKIIEPYLKKFPNQFFYHRKDNGGYGSALEVGIKMAKSEYILVCDPDDYLEENALEKLYNLALINNADVICSARYLVYEGQRNRVYDKMYDSSIVSIYSKTYQRDEGDFGDIYHIENAPHGKLFKRNLLIDLSFPHHLSNTDTILYFGAIFKAQKLVFTEEALSNYRMYRIGNTVTDVKEPVINGLIVSHLNTLKISQSYPDLPSHFYHQMLIAYFYVLSRIQQLQGVDDDVFQRKFKEANQILKRLQNHRAAILKRFKGETSLLNQIKFRILLTPIVSFLAKKALYKNLIQDRKQSAHTVVDVLSDEQIERDIKVSIIVPVYNVDQYLERCLNSLIAQDYENFEIICVNDGSTDASLNILNRYQNLHSNIIKVYTKTNGGLSDARNFGIDKAKGDYICFIDSDDWIDTTLIKSMILKANTTQADVIVCDMVYEFEDGQHKIASGGDFSIIDVSEKPEVMFINNSACNKLFSKQCFKETRFVKGIWYEDLATVPSVLLNAHRIAKVEHSFYHYFQRKGSIVHSPNPKIFDIYQALDLTFESIRKSKHSKRLEKGMKNLFLIHGLDLNTLRIRDYQENRLDYLKKNLSLLRERYPNWYLSSYVFNQGIKKLTLFSLLKFRQYKIALFLFDRKVES